VLTNYYRRLLTSFLGNTYKPFAEDDIMAPARAKGESQRRQKFLENDLRIFYGHWGGYWQLYSYPTISSLTFDKSFRYAIIYYEFIYEGGEAYLKKVNGIWTLISAQRTWIE